MADDVLNGNAAAAAAAATADEAAAAASAALCGFTEECSAGRFVFITAASFAAAAGAAANLVLAYTFVFRKMPSTPPSIYPFVLAIFDALLCVFYVLLFGVDVAMIFLRIEVSVCTRILRISACKFCVKISFID